MGVLIEGAWREEELPQETSSAGEFKRVESAFRDRITADGSSGYKAEAGRYHVYVAWNCPWAHRVLIYLAVKKLDRAISVAHAIPGLRENGWTFEDNSRFPDCTPDRVNGFRFLYQAYQAANPRYTGKVTVPTLWDKKTRRIVNNESSEIIRMLNSAFDAHTNVRTDYYPKELRGEIERYMTTQPCPDCGTSVWRGCGHSRGWAPSASWSPSPWPPASWSGRRSRATSGRGSDGARGRYRPHPGRYAARTPRLFRAGQW